MLTELKAGFIPFLNNLIQSGEIFVFTSAKYDISEGNHFTSFLNPRLAMQSETRPKYRRLLQTLYQAFWQLNYLNCSC